MVATRLENDWIVCTGLPSAGGSVVLSMAVTRLYPLPQGSYASGKCQGNLNFSRSGNCQGIS